VATSANVWEKGILESVFLFTCFCSTHLHVGCAGTHAKLSDAVVQGLVHEVTSLLPSNKRSLTDSLSAIGQSLSSIFQPHVNVLQSVSSRHWSIGVELTSYICVYS
jgi:hypothetical protein